MGTHYNFLDETVLMNTHSIHFYGKIWKIIPKLSSSTLSYNFLCRLQFLQDLLDSLFYILMQNMISDLYDNLVFDALVSIALISDLYDSLVLDALISSIEVL